MRVLLLLVLAATALAQSDPASDAVRAWQNEHPYPRDQAGFAARNKAELEATSAWIKQWPDSKLAWRKRRDALVSTRSQSVEDWSEVADALVRINPPKDADSVRRHLAMDWISAGVLLPKAVGILKDQWDKLEPAAEAADLKGDSEAVAAAALRGVLISETARGALTMKDYKMARWALDKNRQWLETDFPHYFELDPRTFPDYEGRYLRMAAELADAEGRTMDALAAYQTLIVNPWQKQEYGVDRWVARSKELWKQAGGTEEGWRIWAKLHDTGGLSELPRGVAMVPWAAVNRPLPELHLRDLADRTWTLENLRGKRVYVLIWASWCGPCWRYLGGVQKLFDATKNNPDSLLLTLTLDDEPAKAAQFMKEHNYNFPVLMAKDWVANFAGLESIGMSWVLDREARVRLTRGQPPLPEDAWVGEALDKLRSR